MLPTAAQQGFAAEDAYGISGISGSIGLGLASLGHYEGSPNRRVIVGADFSLGYRTRDRCDIELGPRRLPGLGDVRGSAEARLMVGCGPVNLVAQKALDNRGAGGAQVDF